MLGRQPHGRALGAFALALVVFALARPVAGAGVSVLREGSPVQSVFHIAKSENRNQVHYGIKVDPSCRPLGEQPIYAYWRDYEVGPKATSALLEREQPAYGLTRPRAIEDGDSGGQVWIGLRGFPDRRIQIQSFRHRGGCRAWAMTTIERQSAVLGSIYVELGFLFSIDYVLLRGISTADGAPLSEKVDD